MTNTFQSNWNTVADGDTQTHDTSKDSPITITNTEIRWRGITTTTTDYDDRLNLDSYGGLSPSNVGETATLSIPDKPSGETFEEEYAEWVHENVSSEFGGLVEFDWWAYDSTDTVIDSGSDSVDNRSGNFDKTVFYFNFSNEASYVKIKWTKIELTEDTDGLDAHLSTHIEFSSTTNEDTEYPSVSGDISTSYSGTLSDGEVTSWKSVSDFVDGTNSWTHSIAGSNKVDFQFRYDWEYSSSNALYYLRTELNGTTYNLPLVDPTDDLLDYSNLRTTVNGTTVAADLVDTSNNDASPFRVYVPNKGVKAWREG